MITIFYKINSIFEQTFIADRILNIKIHFKVQIFNY